MKTKAHFAALLLAGAACIAGPSRAAGTDAAAADSTFDFFTQEAQVVTASRHAQNISDSPVAIDVITREDIAASGAKNIWDLLRTKVGMDVLQSSSVDGNDAEVSIRGLTGEFSQSLQVLIDGRSVVTAVNSGVYWQDLPIGLDDIERIEIVRGPNSPLFGANAGQGVINIITIKPTDGDSAEFRGEVGQYGYHLGQVGMNTTIDKLRLRVSLTDQSIGSDPSADGDTTKNLNGQPLNRRINVRGDLDAWKGGELEFYAGGTDQTFALPSSTLASSGSYNEQYYQGQLHQKLGDHDLDLTLNGRQGVNTFGVDANFETDYSADAMLRLNYLDGKSTTNLGFGFKQSDAMSNYLFSSLTLGNTTNEATHQGRLYAQETYAPTQWVTASLAGSYENSDLGGDWPAYLAAVVLKPVADNTLRISAGQSPTMPSLENRLMNFVIPEGPGSYVDVKGTDVHPAEISDVEATWGSVWFRRHVTLDVTGYQMQVDGQMELSSNSTMGLQTGPNGHPAFFITIPYVNAVNLRLRGLESVLTYKPAAGTTLELNDTYEDVYSDVSNANTDNVTPWSKLNLIARTELPYGFNLSAQFGYVGQHYDYTATGGTSEGISDEIIVNARIGFKPTKDLELYGVASNLASEYRVESGDGTSIPQMYSCGATLAFGGK